MKLLASAKEEGVSKGDLHKEFKLAMKKQVGHIVTLYEQNSVEASCKDQRGILLFCHDRISNKLDRYSSLMLFTTKTSDSGPVGSPIQCNCLFCYKDVMLSLLGIINNLLVFPV